MCISLCTYLRRRFTRRTPSDNTAITAMIQRRPRWMPPLRCIGQGRRRNKQHKQHNIGRKKHKWSLLRRSLQLTSTAEFACTTTITPAIDVRTSGNHVRETPFNAKSNVKASFDPDEKCAPRGFLTMDRLFLKHPFRQSASPFRELTLGGSGGEQLLLHTLSLQLFLVSGAVRVTLVAAIHAAPRRATLSRDGIHRVESPDIRENSTRPAVELHKGPA